MTLPLADVNKELIVLFSPPHAVSASKPSGVKYLICLEWRM